MSLKTKHRAYDRQGVYHTVALPFTKARERIMETLKNISPCKNTIFKKNALKRNQNPSRYIITL